MKNRRNQNIVITGASSGFGQGVALKFADEGANLVLAARRKRLLKNVAAECERRGARALAVETDVGDEDDVQQLAERGLEEFGRIDVWVNNAGVSTVGRFDEVPLGEHEKVIETNLLGCLYGSYEAMRQFRRQGHGVLINVASYLGKGSAPYHSSYVASKHGVRGLGMALRQEVEASDERGIHVCTVMPTSMDTPFFQHAANHSGRPVRPIPPVYDPQEVVDTIVELARKPQDEVVVGRRGKVGSAIGKLAPAALERGMAKRTHPWQMQQRETTVASSGSVFRPMAVGREVRGGWLGGKPNRGRTALIAGVLAAAVPMIYALLARRPQRRRQQPLQVA